MGDGQNQPHAPLPLPEGVYPHSSLGFELALHTKATFFRQPAPHGGDSGPSLTAIGHRGHPATHLLPDHLNMICHAGRWQALQLYNLFSSFTGASSLVRKGGSFVLWFCAALDSVRSFLHRPQHQRPLKEGESSLTKAPT